MAGVLHVVATPIGNLEDMSPRAVRALREASVIACEDTRRTVKLLNRHAIKKPLLSYFQPREGRRIPEILALLRAGRPVALVSDAGTPGISDPGYRLVQEVLKAGFPVVPVPGPSAAVAALSVSGLPTHHFLYLGFPPPKEAACRRLLETRRREEASLIFYLPARKVSAFLGAALEALGDRRAVIAREMTKVHEEFLRGSLRTLGDAARARSMKGEVVVLIEGYGRKMQRKRPTSQSA